MNVRSQSEIPWNSWDSWKPSFYLPSFYCSDNKLKRFIIFYLLSFFICCVWFQISRKSIYNWPNTLICFSASELDVNSWISWNGERHVCMKCGGTFNRKDHAKRHVINQHIPQAEASCHVCHKTFKNAYYRDTHRSQEHGITKRMMEMKRYSLSNWQMKM